MQVYIKFLTIIIPIISVHQIIKTDMFTRGLGIYNSSVFGSKIPKEMNFQPSDGSLVTAIYYPQTNKACTDLYNYDNVVAINSTIPLTDESTFTNPIALPQLTDDGKYKNSDGQILDQIGSLSYYSEDDTYTYFYYLFGHRISNNNNKKTEPADTYTSQGE
ncbi:MAG: hypothetical protein ACXWL5_00655 [Candidatus Chromulinivorax sp.]